MLSASPSSVQVLVGLLLAIACALLLGTSSAHASYPGDNGLIVFMGKRDGNFEFYSMTEGGDLPVAEFLPAGGSSLRSLSAPAGALVLVAKRLTNHVGFDGRAAFSPDGSKIAFSSKRAGTMAIWTMDLDGSNKQPLTDVEGCRAIDPTRSPDVTQISYIELRAGKGSDTLVRRSISGGPSVPLTKPSEIIPAHPAWSPDGALIAFDAENGLEHDIFVVGADGTGLTPLTDDPARDVLPSWSPDGRRIASQSGRSGSGDIYVMGRDGTGQVPVLEDARPESSPAPLGGAMVARLRAAAAEG